MLIIVNKMLIFDIIVAIAPISGYISQLNLIKEQKSLGTFSIYVCAILMISGILRIFFWFAEGYAINLLFQAIFIIIVQGFLLKQCVELSPRPKDLKQPESFWNWNTFDQYIRFLFGLAAVTTVLTLISQVAQMPLFGPALGFLSMSIQATLGFPQMFSNWRTKSVKGLSFVMIFTWFAGDLFKTIYFIMEAQKQPLQFVMCGAVQLTVDVIIIAQILMYRNNEGNEHQKEKSEASKKNNMESGYSL